MDTRSGHAAGADYPNDFEWPAGDASRGCEPTSVAERREGGQRRLPVYWQSRRSCGRDRGSGRWCQRRATGMDRLGWGRSNRLAGVPDRAELSREYPSRRVHRSAWLPLATELLHARVLLRGRRWWWRWWWLVEVRLRVALQPRCSQGPTTVSYRLGPSASPSCRASRSREAAGTGSGCMRSAPMAPSLSLFWRRLMAESSGETARGSMDHQRWKPL